MSLGDRFSSAIAAVFEQRAGVVELMPMVFAQACVDVLGVDGAGLSMTGDLRVPLGASDDTVARAERLQTTIGEGPCLAAAAEGEPLIIDQDMMGRWPIFERELLAHTPFRSIASFPLRNRHDVCVGALDLYSSCPEVLPIHSPIEITTHIAEPLAAVLFDDPPTTTLQGAPVPIWVMNSPADDRLNVWLAVGMFMEYSKLSNADALSVMRGYAFTHDVTLDELAQGLTDREVTPQAVLA